RQLSLISEQLYHAIPFKELINPDETGTHEMPCIMKMAARFNQVRLDGKFLDLLFFQISYWVATEIVLSSNIQQRKTVIQRFLTVAKYCKRLHNYSDLIAIVSGLNNSAVSRQGLISIHYNFSDSTQTKTNLEISRNKDDKKIRIFRDIYSCQSKNF